MKGQSGSRNRTSAVLWLGLAVLAVASVLILNGRPLFYFDTVGYVDQGKVALQQLGLTAAPPVEPSGGTVAASALRTVDGSRSPFYSLLAGIFDALHAVDLLLLFNALVLALALWLTGRVLRRVYEPDQALAPMIAVPVLAAALGSLPFYAAYLMPDLLAPVMLLVIALLTAFGREMTAGELLLAFLIASVSIISHLSHFAIGAALVPFVAALSRMGGRRRWMIAPLILIAVVGVAWMQQKTFRVIAAHAAQSDVVIKPFITARLIQDGPGYDWLEAHCPDETIPSCPLWDALQLSQDPYRLTASHIVFETSKRLGSFRLMSETDQKQVADAQVGFFKDVLREMPLAVSWAFIVNTFKQSAMVSVDMTLPTRQIEAQNVSVTGTLSGPLTLGRLSESRADWLGPVTRLQKTYYAAALVMTLALLLSRGLPQGLRIFGMMVLLGILANAFVCGGISQPATRYGARVVWLVPLLAALLLHWTMRAGEERA
ncbi:MAG TPA: hypothetical protein PK450_11850 [Paracoccaceae bacterium]|nr:hypothetical protein [Paracoccaceae bacterium]